MADYDCYVYPTTEFYEQPLTSSLDDGVERPSYDDYYVLHDRDLGMEMLHVTLDARVVRRWTKRNSESYVFPEWSSNLFGHILVIPPRLDLGNLLSNQSRSIEIANLFLTARDWEGLTTDVIGLTFDNAPAGLFDSPPVPYAIPSFGSYILEVSISTDGPATIDGGIELDFDVEDITVPVTGTRVVMFPFQPRPGIMETLEWKTDILTSDNDSEQRLGLRAAPRQRFVVDVLLDDDTDYVMRGLMFDWLARVFGVPIWWEARTTTAPIVAGAVEIDVSTLYGDFRVGGLVMIWASNETYDVVEIESYDSVSIQLASEIGHDYPAGTLVTPVRTAYSRTVPSAKRIPAKFTEYSTEFTTIENVDLSDQTDSEIYDDRVMLSDCNLRESGEEDSYSRSVIVLDNETGRVFQTSRADRSRFRTKKVWDSPDLQELWRIRRLLHSFNGSRLSFFLPTFRPDLVISQPIGAGSQTLRVVNYGYTTFFQSRRPYADIRLLLVDGRILTRHIESSEVDGSEEVLSVDEPFDPISIINIADVIRIEYAMLMRISDDRATIEHRHLGDAKVEVNLVSIRE